MAFAVIGGTGVDELPEVASGRQFSVTTKFGTAEVVELRMGAETILFIPRHGRDHSTPPSRINSRSQIAALKKLGVDSVIGVAAAGSLSPSLGPGAVAVLGDFIDLTRRSERSFFDEPEGPVVHTDFTVPYCPRLSDVLTRACESAGAAFRSDAVYVGVDGPRYETPAEIRLYASWGGHVIGMTNVPEVVLAREAGLCYAAVAVVTNFAAGLSPAPLAHDEVRQAMLHTSDLLRRILNFSLSALPGSVRCTCASNTALRV